MARGQEAGEMETGGPAQASRRPMSEGTGQEDRSPGRRESMEGEGRGTGDRERDRAGMTLDLKRDKEGAQESTGRTG